MPFDGHFSLRAGREFFVIDGRDGADATRRPFRELQRGGAFVADDEVVPLRRFFFRLAEIEFEFLADDHRLGILTRQIDLSRLLRQLEAQFNLLASLPASPTSAIVAPSPMAKPTTAETRMTSQIRMGRRRLEAGGWTVPNYYRGLSPEIIRVRAARCSAVSFLSAWHIGRRG